MERRILYEPDGQLILSLCAADRGGGDNQQHVDALTQLIPHCQLRRLDRGTLTVILYSIKTEEIISH